MTSLQCANGVEGHGKFPRKTIAPDLPLSPDYDATPAARHFVNVGKLLKGYPSRNVPAFIKPGGGAAF